MIARPDLSRRNLRTCNVPTILLWCLQSYTERDPPRCRPASRYFSGNLPVPSAKDATSRTRSPLAAPPRHQTRGRAIVYKFNKVSRERVSRVTL